MSWSNPALKISECVESDASVGSVMELLVSRGIASPFNQGATTLCKRQDGSTIPFNVNPDEPLSALEVKLKQLENIEVQGLTFVQAQDGCMHISVWPSSAAPESLPVYVRSNGPQPPLRKKTVTAGTTTLADLSKELCV